MTEYFYDKYALNIDYEEIPQTVEIPTETYTVYTDNIIVDDVSHDGITMDLDLEGASLNFYFIFKNEYEVVINRTYGGIKDYKFVVSGDTSAVNATLGTSVYRRINDHIIDRYRPILKTIWDYHGVLHVYIVMQKMAILELDRKTQTIGGGTEVVVDLRKIITKGALLETNVIKDHTYPANGHKNGYWWIRKGLYTIPAPALISPDNAHEVNKKDGDEMPYLVFELTPRETNDSNLYHVRARLGFRSDFADYELYLGSKEDVSNWEYYDGSTWQSFPPGGVSANTKVRIKPDVESFEFGFYYWDCTAYNSQWGYGVSSEHRVIIVLDETDGVYVLVVNGIQYNAINLKISESSNGETGLINIVLSNNNI